MECSIVDKSAMAIVDYRWKGNWHSIVYAAPRPI